MKTLYTLLLAGILSLTLFPKLNGQTYDPNYLDGSIYLKVLDNSPVIPDPLTIPALGTIFSTFGVDTIYRAFSSPDPLVNKIYRLEFNLIPSTGQLLTALQALSFVDYAEQVPLFKTQQTAAYTPNDLVSQQWYLNQIDAPMAWDLQRGDSQVVVAIVDNAVLTSHEDLAGVLWVNPGEIPNNFFDDDLNGYIDDINGYDVADYDNNPNPPSTGTGWDHGTHCAGIAAAQTDNGTGIASIGFGIRIMSVKASLSLTGGNTLERAYEGVDYAIAAGADVISLSWGSLGNSLTGQRVMAMAALNDVVLVAAAGNNNDSIPFYPAAYPQTIAVGATDAADQKSSFSNFGTYIDVMAPGSAIYSSLATSTSSYGNLSGTSMACPLTAGLCGLIMSNSPGNFTAAQVRSILENGCVNIDQQNPQYIGKMGAGRINAFKSLESFLVSAEEPLAPQAEIRMYPNPAQDFLVIQTGNSNHGTQFRLLDLQGKAVISQAVPEGLQPLNIDLSGVNPGLYLVELQSRTTRQTAKLVVQ